MHVNKLVWSCMVRPPGGAKLITVFALQRQNYALLFKILYKTQSTFNSLVDGQNLVLISFFVSGIIVELSNNVLKIRHFGVHSSMFCFITPELREITTSSLHHQIGNWKIFKTYEEITNISETVVAKRQKLFQIWRHIADKPGNCFYVFLRVWQSASIVFKTINSDFQQLLPFYQKTRLSVVMFSKKSFLDSGPVGASEGNCTLNTVNLWRSPSSIQQLYCSPVPSKSCGFIAITYTGPNRSWFHERIFSKHGLRKQPFVVKW